MMSQDRVKQVKEMYPIGSRILLLSMNDAYEPVPPNTKGTVRGVDGAGHILMNWDNGRTLSLIVEEDQFTLL